MIVSESKGIDANRTGFSTFQEHNICHFYIFKNRNFLCQSLVCSDAMMLPYMLILLRDIKIIQVKGNTYRVINNLLYSESYCLYESSYSTDKFGAL